MELVFATNNNNKIQEIQNLLDSSIHLLSLADIGCLEDIPENQLTLEANAFQKANYIYAKYNYNCFADDTGLEIEALNGEPGVFSARYAGESKDSTANIQKVLKKLVSIKNRKARFKTVICLILNGDKIFFEGVIYGKIIHAERGSKGFGYDPIFVPNTYNKTFAEMSLKEKNSISHRAIAIKKLTNYLNLK